MEKLFGLLFIILSFNVYGLNTKNESGDNIRYIVSGHFDDTTKTFIGKETIIFKNDFKDTLQAVYMRLDANAYSLDTTKYSNALVSANKTAFYFSGKNEKGYISGLKLSITNSEVEIASIDTISYELLKINLSQPLHRDQTMELTTLVNIQLPYNFNNNGFTASTIYFQNWIPKIAGFYNGDWCLIPFEYREKVYTNTSNYNFQIGGLDKYKIFYSSNVISAASEIKLLGNSSDIIAISNPSIQSISRNNREFVFVQEGQKIPRDVLNKISDTLARFISKLETNYGNFPLEKINVYINLFSSSYDENDKIFINYPSKKWQVKLEQQVASIFVNNKLNINSQSLPYLSNGLAQYYYEQTKKQAKSKFPQNHFPNDFNNLLLDQLENTKQLQSYRLSTDQYNSKNFPISPTYSFSKILGSNSSLADSLTNLLQSNEANSGNLFNQHYKDSFYVPMNKKEDKLSFLFNLNHTDKYRYWNIAPSIGYNNYDKFMLGALIHNYQLPLNKFNFLVAPMYSFSSKKINGAARLEYNIWNPKDHWKFGIGGVRYSINELNQPQYERLFQSMYRITPRIDYIKYLGETKDIHVFVRDLIISHQDYRFNYNADNNSYSAYNQNFNNNIVQANISLEDRRNLYPYSANLDIMQVKNILRLAWTGKYFFNYNAKCEGISTRLFAGKIFYLKDQTNEVQVNNAPFGFYMNGPSGNQDFLYSDYFIGRNETSGWMNQQIMERDGFFKVKTPGLSSSNLGFSDNWLSSLNVVADIPQNWNPFQVLPFKIPLKVFVDIGSYSELWSGTDNSEKLLYDAGFQLSLFKSLVNVYIPIVYSRKYRDAYNSVPNNKFLRTLSFSINLNALNYKKYL